MMNQPAQVAHSVSSLALPDLPEASPVMEIVQETVACYFETLSAEDFQTTANLFAEGGILYPPFESAVIGREAIVTYLETEAKGLKLLPLNYITEPLEEGNVQCKVQGKVQTPLFSVNVAWHFILNSAFEMTSVQIKLLAALEELLRLKPKS